MLYSRSKDYMFRPLVAITHNIDILYSNKGLDFETSASNMPLHNFIK